MSIARAGLWSAIAFGFNLLWEIAHVRLYTLWNDSNGPDIAWSVVHCSVGDALIAFAAFVLAGFMLRRADWPLSRPVQGCAIVVVATLAYTAWSEWYNVRIAGAWAYSAGMPTIFGIGLSPLAQWLVLPPLLLVAYRAAIRIGAKSGNQSGV